jgi:hypothetical protein
MTTVFVCHFVSFSRSYDVIDILVFTQPSSKGENNVEKASPNAKVGIVETGNDIIHTGVGKNNPKLEPHIPQNQYSLQEPPVEYESTSTMKIQLTGTSPIVIKYQGYHTEECFGPYHGKDPSPGFCKNSSVKVRDGNL